MRIDDAGKRDAARGIDHLRIRRRQRRTDRDDLAVLHQDVGSGQVARFVHGHHIGLAQEQPAHAGAPASCSLALAGSAIGLLAKRVFV